jgi:hypothetical protein
MHLTIYQSTPSLLLPDERDFNNQNITRSKTNYINRLVMGNMNADPVQCAHIRHHDGIYLSMYLTSNLTVYLYLCIYLSI